MAHCASGSSSSVAAMLGAIETLLVANGWSVYHRISVTAGATDTVFRGTPLDTAADNRPFIRLTQLSTTSFAMLAYADYEAAASLRDNGDPLAGIWECGATASCTINGLTVGSLSYLLRANGHSLAISTFVAGTPTKIYAGFVRRMLDFSHSGVARISAAILAGDTSVATAVDMTSRIQPGQVVHIVANAHDSAGAAKERAEAIVVDTVTPTSITFRSAIRLAYAGGALVGTYPLPILSSAPTTSALPCSTSYTPHKEDGSRSSGVLQNISPTALGMYSAAANVDPSTEGLYGLGVFDCGNNTNHGWYGTYHHWVFVPGAGVVVGDTLSDASGNLYTVQGVSVAANCAIRSND